MEMKQHDTITHPVVRRHRTSERALTLAILTALLAGATVTPVMAKDVTIDISDGKHCYGDESSGGHVTGVNATVTGTDTTDKIVHVYGGYASGGYNATNNTVNFLADKNGKGNLWMYGGYSSDGDATGNTVMISGGTVSRRVCGGDSNTGDATGNTVIISGGTVSGRVFGGYSNTGDATGNKIIIRAGENGETATFGKHTILYGGYSGSGTGSDNALIFQGVKNVEVGKVYYFDKYQFLLGDDFNDTDVFLNLTDGIMQGNAEVCVAYANADGTISLMKITPLSSGISSDGLKLVPYENEAKTASITTAGTFDTTDNNTVLKLNVADVAYKFAISDNADALKNGDAFFTFKRKGTLKVSSDQVTFQNGKLLLSEGDKIYLLKNDEAMGKLEYTATDDAQKWVNTYKNEKATVTTTSAVNQVDNDLVLSVSDVKYAFDLTTAKTGDAAFLTSQNAGTTTIAAKNVDITANQNTLLNINKGDTFYLLENTTDTGKLAYTGSNTWTHNYEATTDAGTATVATTGTVKADGNDLKLNIDEQTYAFNLSADAKNNDTFLTSTNTGTTKIYDLDLTVANGSKLQPGDTVYLLKNTSTGTVEYTGAKALSVGATYTNEKGDASIATAFTVEQSDDKKNLALKVGDNGTYIFNLIPNARDGYTFIENTNAETLVLQGSKIKLDAADGKMLSLNKGDNVYLLKKTDGTLTYDSTNAPTLSHTYENSAKNAAVTTTGAVTQEGNNLVLNVSDVAYKFTLAPDMTDGDTFLNSANTGETKISSDDVTLDDSSLSGKLLSFNEGDTLYLLKNTDTGTLTYTEGTATPTLNHTYKNDKSTATVQTTGTVQADGKDLILNIDDVKYTFKLTTDMEKNDPLLTLDNAGETKIGTDDVTIDASEWDGKLLSLEKGNSRCLIKNTATGTITYAGNETLNHVINVKNANDMDILKLTTTGTVETDSTNKNLNLDITNVKYSFFLPDGTKNGDTLIELKGETRPRTIDDVEVQAAPDAIMNLNKGDTVCLLDDVASFLGTKDMTQSVNLQYDGTNADGVKTVNITTMGTVGTDSTGIAGKKLNLGVTNVKYSFFLPDGTKNGDTLFTLTNGADTKIDEVAVHAAASDAIMNLNKDDTVYLLKKEGGTLSTENMTQSVDLLYGVTAKLKGIVLQDENNLIFKITDEITGPEADTKSFLETRVAQSSLLNLGADYLVDTTLAQIKDTPDTAYGDDGFTAFGGTQGTAKMRYETGSYVDLNGVVFNAGIAKRQANKRGAFTWGPFFETGSGNYDSYLDNGTHGSGDTSYTGGGLLARQAFASGLYVEGSLRFGRTKADDSSLIEDTRASYDTSSPYFGAHLGVGNLYHVNDADTLDVYGRYLFSRVGSDSVQLSTGEMYDFDDVMSHRLVLGARYTRDYGKTGKGYVGLVYQYEFGGDARAHWNGDSLLSPSVEGSTVKLETGWTYTPTETTPLALDLGISGSMGKERGIAFHAGLNYAF